MKKILGCIKRAQQEFNLINDGDVIGVGLSGGKDSMVLLYALSLYRNFSPVNYSLKAITIDMGFDGFETDILSDFCEKEHIDFILKKTDMGKLIFEERQEQNPCGFCSRMRRGLLNKICDDNEITRLALGHHGDDLIETFLMSWIYESRLHCFKAVTEFERAEVTQIRPLIYACEKDISEASARHKLPTIINPCPASGNTNRELMKTFIDQIERTTCQPRTHMINAICKSSIISSPQ